MCVCYMLYCTCCIELCGDDYDFSNMSCTPNQTVCTWRKVWIHPAPQKCEHCKFCKKDCKEEDAKRPPRYILYDVKMTETFRLET